MLMQITAMLFAIVQFFVLGAAFGAGAWIVWRALDRRSGRFRKSGEPPDGQPQRQPNPLS